MKVVLYSRSKLDTKVDTATEEVCPRIALIYAERFSVSNFYSEILLLWRDRDKLGDRFYCYLFDAFYCKGEPNSDFEKGSCIKFYNDLKDLRKIKHKDKTILVALQQLEHLLKNIITDVNNWFESNLNARRLMPLIPFEKEEDVFVLMPNDRYLEDSKGEDHLIKYIIESFSDYDEELIFDQVIVEMVPNVRLNEKAEINTKAKNPFFFSMPLFSFPLMIDLNHPQLANVRNELNPVFVPFNEDYDLLKEELASVVFEKEQGRIQPLLKKHIVPHLVEIQKNIDKNIYIQQEKNRYSANYQIKVMIGVTSIENQIRLLEKEEIIKPFVAAAIIEKLAKNFDIKTCVPFIYHIYPKTNITS